MAEPTQEELDAALDDKTTPSTTTNGQGRDRVLKRLSEMLANQTLDGPTFEAALEEVQDRFANFTSSKELGDYWLQEENFARILDAAATNAATAEFRQQERLFDEAWNAELAQWRLLAEGGDRRADEAAVLLEDLEAQKNDLRARAMQGYLNLRERQEERQRIIHAEASALGTNPAPGLPPKPNSVIDAQNQFMAGFVGGNIIQWIDDTSKNVSISEDTAAQLRRGSQDAQNALLDQRRAASDAEKEFEEQFGALKNTLFTQSLAATGEKAVRLNDAYLRLQKDEERWRQDFIRQRVLGQPITALDFLNQVVPDAMQSSLMGSEAVGSVVPGDARASVLGLGEFRTAEEQAQATEEQAQANERQRRIDTLQRRISSGFFAPEDVEAARAEIARIQAGGALEEGPQARSMIDGADGTGAGDIFGDEAFERSLQGFVNRAEGRLGASPEGIQAQLPRFRQQARALAAAQAIDPTVTAGDIEAEFAGVPLDPETADRRQRLLEDQQRREAPPTAEPISTPISGNRVETERDGQVVTTGPGGATITPQREGVGAQGAETEGGLTVGEETIDPVTGQRRRRRRP